MKQIMITILKGIAPMTAVGIGVLLATQPTGLFQSDLPRQAEPVVQTETPPAHLPQRPIANKSPRAVDAPPPYVLELHAMIDTLRSEVAALRDERPSDPIPGVGADFQYQPPAYNPDEDPNELAERILAAQQQAKDVQQQFAHRFAAAPADAAWTQRLQASVGSLASEIAGTELAGVAVTHLECRNVGCEIQVSAKDVPSDIVSLMLEAQLDGEGYIQDVIAAEEGQLRVLVARRG